MTGEIEPAVPALGRPVFGISRNLLLYALKFLIGAGCLGLAVYSFPSENWQLLGSQWQLTCILILGWLGNQLLCALRLKIILRIFGYQISNRLAIMSVMASFFVASVMPGIVLGDAAKIAILRFASGGSIAELSVVAILDRMLGLISLLAVSFLLAFVVHLPPEAQGILLTVRLLSLATILGLAVVVLAKRFVSLPTTLVLGPRWLRIADRVLGLARVVTSRRTATLLLLLALPTSLAAVFVLVASQAGVGALLLEATGHQADFLLQAFLSPASILVATLPISPSGIGIGQLTLSTAYDIAGLPAHPAIILTSMSQLAQISLACTLGLYSFLILRVRVSD